MCEAWLAGMADREAGRHRLFDAAQRELVYSGRYSAGGAMAKPFVRARKRAL